MSIIGHRSKLIENEEYFTQKSISLFINFLELNLVESHPNLIIPKDPYSN
jgi:hypothetical protein